MEKVGERTIIDALNSNIAVLDGDGVVMMTNRAWQMYALQNGYVGRPDAIGINYLNVAENAYGASAEYAFETATGIRSVIDGALNEFVLDYPCHSPGKERWFIMRAVPFTTDVPRSVIVSHEDITIVKQAAEKIRRREKKILEQKREVDELNIALKVLIRQRESEKEQLEQLFMSNVRELVIPFIERLKNSRLNHEQTVITEIIENHLAEITKPLLTKFRTNTLYLTPMEVRVSTLIRDGLTSKEIADILRISKSAVDFHRKNIRKKFSLTHSRKSLKSHLTSLL